MKQFLVIQVKLKFLKDERFAPINTSNKSRFEVALLKIDEELNPGLQ
ncbi:hypothetical protein LCM02_14835 [Lutimonas saemankumensis]|nr:hypothetical protein [Lutimonas saemankumensis]MCA0933734.1 hypothetical protein [Lutimonas saemankumensis]